MSTYLYNCEKCGEFERTQKMTDNELTICPKCKGKIYRVIRSGVGLIFKGKGFYETDYKRRK